MGRELAHALGLIGKQADTGYRTFNLTDQPPFGAAFCC
jgi:hypothetical protein